MLSSTLLTETAVFHIGPQQKDYIVHRQLLTLYSGFYDASLNGQFAERDAAIITQADTTPCVFERFRYWLYNGILYPLDTPMKSIGAQELAEVYGLADLYIIPALKNAAIDAYKNFVTSRWTMDTSASVFIFSRLPKGCAFQKLYLKGFLGTTGKFGNWLQKPSGRQIIARRCHPEFLAEMIMQGWVEDPPNQFSREDWEAMEVCGEYHDHERPCVRV